MPSSTAGPQREDAPADFVSDAAKRRIGCVLGGQWSLERLIGLGGTACVYEGLHRNGSRVAIKVLHKHLSHDARAKRRFLSEGYAVNRVSHPGVVTVLHDAEDADGSAYLVMTLLSGHTASQRLAASGPLSPQHVRAIGGEILQVLSAAHSVGVVHRDVKPSNIFFCDDGSIKLLDFGSARFDFESGVRPLTTRSEAILGTPAFMAPEIAAGRAHEVDELTDIWSVGATLFQLLTGRTVHAARTVNEAIVASATMPAPLVGEVCPAIPATIARIVDRALSFEREARWPNTRAMQSALAEKIEEPCGNGDPLSTLPEEPSRPRQISVGRGRYVSLSIAMGLCGGLIAWDRTRDVDVATEWTAKALTGAELPSHGFDLDVPVLQISVAAAPSSISKATGGRPRKLQHRAAPTIEEPIVSRDMLDRRK